MNQSLPLENDPLAKKITLVSSETIACYGFDPIFGHPKIYLNIPLDTEVKCPYCSRIYLRTDLV
ncbi:MAG: hypothetical protein B7Y25_08340 [Alphaproteobacteria bacterium 16-39-46]|nr:MAG: hypothetical protein B7Y25_08340 [Alphaproteobacteria bacterium 16-39-46]OZA41131.1 MAG: hypothetical protein B7X84_08525 [Alphaproteobacteria bacterium 17-39-52]HQS84882.1 zinc-finger domain-containing protein [Alphaproteobacteria bacterium]HQS94656.1 zinc-finger domain-containing protein [Alphaproteobacteria bacterium]